MLRLLSLPTAIPGEASMPPLRRCLDTMVSDMLALIDTHHHETFTQAD
jgi:hypothetical protein